MWGRERSRKDQVQSCCGSVKVLLLAIKDKSLAVNDGDMDESEEEEFLDEIVY